MTISRRKFLKLGPQAALAGGVLAANSAKAKSVADVDVIVIGAGISGLAAASQLQNQGYEVIVLEARPHIGGRLRTDWSLGAPFEVGAGWIHGPSGNPVTKLAKAVNANMRVTEDDSFQVFSHDGVEQEYENVYETWDGLDKIFRKIDDQFDGDQPLSQAIKKVAPKALADPLLSWILSADTEFDTGGPLEKLSAYYFDEDKAFNGADVILTTGYDEILKPLAKGIDIRLNQPVTRVEYEKGDGATVFSGDAAYEASFVISTLPLGVLHAGDVTFDPPLPKAQRNRINRIGMGNVAKLAMKFDKAYWPKDTQYFGLMTRERGRWNYFLNYRTFSDQNILLGLSVGAYAGKVEKLSDKAMLADCMKAVRTMFGQNVPDPQAHLATKWSRDKFSKGAYSYSKLGIKPSDFDKQSKPIEDVLVFAGEHTIFKYHATVHGAYMSGLRAADIVDRLAD
jgi:monoamine oxidase